MDESRNKHTKVEISPQGKSRDDIQETNYEIRRIDLIKQTHESAKEDVHSTLDSLIIRCDRDKEIKDKLKLWVEQLTFVLYKITQSSQMVEPIGSSIDEEAMKMVDQTLVHGVNRMLSQGTHLLSSTIKLLKTLDSVGSQLDETLVIRNTCARKGP